MRCCVIGLCGESAKKSSFLPEVGVLGRYISENLSRKEDNSDGHNNKRPRCSTNRKQNDAQNPADYAKHHQTGHFIHLIGGNRAREHRTLTYFVYKSKTRTVPRKTSDNMGKKRYFCSHCNDFVSRGTRSRHLKDLAATNEAFFDSDNTGASNDNFRKISVRKTI